MQRVQNFIVQGGEELEEDLIGEGLLEDTKGEEEGAIMKEDRVPEFSHQDMRTTPEDPQVWLKT